MTFRLKITKNNGREYAAIVEDVYNKDRKGSSSRTLKTFGDLVKKRQENPNIDAQIQEEINTLNSNLVASSTAWTNRYLKSTELSKANTLKKVCYGMAFYRKLWEQLGLHTWFDRAVRNSRGKIKYDLDLAVFFLTSMRILAPVSKSKSYELRHQHIFDFNELSLDNIYSSLADIAEKKQTIIKNLNAGIKTIYQRVETIALYDVTTFYFESFDRDALRERGMSKENKTNEVQVVLGLLVDNEGIPIDYELFKGNTSELKTIIEVVNKYRLENDLEKVTIIADRGLNSYFNLKELSSLGFDYIVAQSIDRLSSKIKEQVFDDNWDEISYDEEGNEIFKTKEIEQSTAEGLDNKIIVTWSSKRQAHDLKVLNERYLKSKELIEKGIGAVNGSFKHGCRQFIKLKNRKNKEEYVTNEDLYKKRVKSAGFYALTSSKTGESAKEIYHNLRQLWHIEECFRVMKTNLETRPVYVWTTAKIKGHFLICYLALVLERLSYYKVKQHPIEISNHKLIELLSESNLAILDESVCNKTLYMRLGSGASEELNDKEAKLIDNIFEILNIPPLGTTETAISLRKKFSLSKNIKIIA